MKKKILKRQLIKEIKRLKEQQSKHDPSTSCMGRGIYCKHTKTGNIVEASFILRQSKRVDCRCPKGYKKTFIR